MKFKFLIYCILCIFFISNAYSINFEVVIEGKFPGAEGKNIRLMKYSDQISYTREEIAEYNIDSDGRFRFNFKTYEPIYVFYRIDHASMGHFVEPGNKYKVLFDPVDFDTLDDRRNPYLDPWYFSFDIYNNDKPDKLNKKISEFNSTFDDFLLEHFSNIRRQRLDVPFEKFRNKTDSIFDDYKSENLFFQEYYEYKYALYYRVANIKSPNTLYTDYIIDEPILYNNPLYMDFFNSIFDKFIFASSRNISIYDLRVCVNEHQSYNALMDTLGKEDILRNEVLRELVMLKGLQDMYHNPIYRKKGVESIVYNVKRNSRFPEHRNIAENIYNNFKKLTKDSPAPKLNLVDNNGNSKCLEDYKGNYLLINFWTSWCVVCHQEFSLLNEIHKKHKDSLAVLSISADRHIEDYKQFIKRYNYPWDFFHFNGNFRLLDKYEVRQFPLFVLINPEGNIIVHSAPFPSQGLKKNISKYFDSNP